MEEVIERSFLIRDFAAFSTIEKALAGRKKSFRGPYVAQAWLRANKPNLHPNRGFWANQLKVFVVLDSMYNIMKTRPNLNILNSTLLMQWSHLITSVYCLLVDFYASTLTPRCNTDFNLFWFFSLFSLFGTTLPYNITI